MSLSSMNTTCLKHGTGRVAPAAEHPSRRGTRASGREERDGVDVAPDTVVVDTDGASVHYWRNN